MQHITILGAGLVGSLLSLYLAKHGFDVEIFERRNDPRIKGAEKGRSINLALSDRGWRGLEGVDKKLAEEVKKMAIPMKGRMIHTESGQPSLQPYGREDQAIYSISRSGLNKILINYAEQNFDVKFHFNERCVELDTSKDEIVLENTKTGTGSLHKSNFIFGADGAFSALRTSLLKTDRFNYSQQYIDYGYKELTIPASPAGQHQLFKNALHIWPRKSFMLIALPNPDGSFTCTLFLAFEGDESFASLTSEELVNSFFKNNFQEIIDLIPDLATEFFTNPTSSLVTIKCSPWIHKDKFALIGDAAHAIVPFYGQGMNAGFEDCTILDKLIATNRNNWKSILDTFQKQRKQDTDAIAELALRNFIEMRDLVADERFQLRKKIESRLTSLFPKDWIPLYSMVTFTSMRYSEALQLGKIQDELMQEVLDISGIERSWENLDFECIVQKYKKIKNSSRINS